MGAIDPNTKFRANPDLQPAQEVTAQQIADTGGGSSLTVTDDTTTVTSTGEIEFTSGATVTDAGGGKAQVAISGGGSPAGTTGQLQYNDDGTFGAVAEGTSGQFLGSNGPGVAPTMKDAPGGGVSNTITYTGDATGLTVIFYQAGLNAGGVFASGVAIDDQSVAPGIETIDYGDISFAGLIDGFGPTFAAATTVDFSALITAAYFQPTFAAAATVDFSTLTTVVAYFQPTFTAATTVDFSALTTVTGNFQPTFAAATSVDFSSLTTVTGSFQPLIPLVTTFTLPAIVSLLGGVVAGGLSACENFTLGATLKSCGTGMDFTFTGAALTQASVDGILESLAALDGTGGTTAFSGVTVDLSGGTSATPGSAGLTAKATLVGRGCTVTTN